MEDGRVKMEEKENQLDLRWWALGGKSLLFVLKDFSLTFGQK